MKWFYEDEMTFRDIRDIAHYSIGLISKLRNHPEYADRDSPAICKRIID